MKINFSKYYILTVLAIVSVIISGLGYLYVYSFIVKQAEAYSETMKKVETEKEKKKNEQEIIKLYADTLADRTRLETFFVSEDKIVDLIESVERVGPDSRTEISLSSINVSDGHVKFHIEAKGVWSNILRALVLTENLPYSISLDNVRIFSSEKQWTMSSDIEVLTIK